jgi:hypothetical protein
MKVQFSLIAHKLSWRNLLLIRINVQTVLIGTIRLWDAL